MYVEPGSYFLFLQEQIKDIIITLRDTASHTGLRHAAMLGHAQAARTLLSTPRRRKALEAEVEYRHARKERLKIQGKQNK